MCLALLSCLNVCRSECVLQLPNLVTAQTVLMSGSHVYTVTAGTAAILAVGGSKPTVTVDDNGRFGVQKVMKVNLTCDHRIVYGAGAAEFMVELKSVIENPEQLTF